MDRAGYGKAVLGMARQNRAGKETWRGRVRLGLARRGKAWRGPAWHFRAGKEDHMNQRLRVFVEKCAVCLVWSALALLLVLFIALMNIT